MIQAHELRLGNYILYLDELYVVDGLKYESNAPGSKWRIMFRTINADNIARQVLRSGKMENWINPIPLTPELLEKCGFEYNYYDGYRHQISLPNGYGLSYTPPNFEVINFAGAWIPCKYLHQLMNLFYALTGTELNVKL